MAVKSGRKSAAQMQPLQKTREQQIAALIAVGGMTNDDVWDFFETKMPQIIKPDSPKRVAGLVQLAYDAEERAKLGRAIRSVRGLTQKARLDNNELADVLGEGAGRPAQTVDYENIKRYDTGDPVMNWIHGRTDYVYLLPDSLKPGMDAETGKLNGPINEETGEVWNYGDLIPKKMLAHMNPTTGHFDPDFTAATKLPYGTRFGDKTGYHEEGIAEAWVDVEGGQKGVGKSRHKIAVMKTLCKMHPDRMFLYNYGESNLPQLRQWMGTDVPKNLIVSEQKTLSGLLGEIYRWQPLAVVQDSIQTLIDARTAAGLYETVGTLKALVTEQQAGRPHMFLISQLNKKGDLRGSSELGFLADSVFRVFRPGLEDNGEFIYESDKNRGAPTPRGAKYKHTAEGVVCLGSGTKAKPFNLVQGGNPILNAGIGQPPTR